MPALHRSIATSVAVLLLGACAGRPALAPVAPQQASAEVAAAQSAFTQQPSATARLRLGKAQYFAKDYALARATLAPLLDQSGSVGADANLFDAASADASGDYTAARRGYTRYLAVHDDAGVRARLADVGRKEADTAAKAAIAGERSLDAAQLPAKSVGVAPLYVAAGDTSLAPLGYGLADLLITDLSRSAQLQVVDRVRMDALLQELRLSQSGRVDTTTAPRIGKLVGARRLVNGALDVAPGGAIVVNARVADAAQGTLVGSPISTKTSLADILDAEKALAFRVFDELGVTLTPAERAAVEQRPTRYLSAFLAYSRGVRAEALGDLPAAHAAFQAAVHIDPGFQLASSHMAGTQPPDGATPPNSPPPPPLPPNGVVEALNPSPAGVLGTIRDRGDANQRAILESGTLATIFIKIFVP